MAEVTIFSNIDEIRKNLEAHIQSGHLSFLLGSGASMPAINVAGDIEREINKLIKDGRFAEANLKALEFIESIEDVNARLFTDKESKDVLSTLECYKNFLSIADQILFERKNLLLPRQAAIFTTNYDAFVEVAAGELPSILLNDGFDRTTMQSDQFRFAPEKFFDRTFRSNNGLSRPAEVPSFNLIKLHGSMTWRRVGEDIVFGTTPFGKLKEDAKADEKKVAEEIQKRSVILPNIGKFRTTVLERTYFDLLRLYSNMLERENALFISFGFSFADEHILDITRRSLRNPTAKLIVFAYSPEAAEQFKTTFKEQRNVLIFTPEAGANISFETFNKTLKSVIDVAAKTS